MSVDRGLAGKRGFFAPSGRATATQLDDMASLCLDDALVHAVLEAVDSYAVILNEHFGIPYSHVGFGGKLHLTIGALGRDRAAATFHPGQPGHRAGFRG